MSTTIYTSNGKILINGSNNKWLKASEGPAPIVISPYTMRMKFQSGYDPSGSIGPPMSKTCVDAGNNIWDISIPNGSSSSTLNWLTQFAGSSYNDQNKIIEILAVNIGEATDITSLFMGCSAITTIPLFDTSSCTSADELFSGCTSLTSVPQFDLSGCTSYYSMFKDCSSLTSIPVVTLNQEVTLVNVAQMYYGCTNVETGILNAYNSLVARNYPNDEYYYQCFKNCGSNTVAGAAELAQIPSGWK